MNIKKRQKLKTVRVNFDSLVRFVIESDARRAVKAAAMLHMNDVRSAYLADSQDDGKVEPKP